MNTTCPLDPETVTVKPSSKSSVTALLYSIVVCAFIIAILLFIAGVFLIIDASICFGRNQFALCGNNGVIGAGIMMGVGVIMIIGTILIGNCFRQCK